MAQLARQQQIEARQRERMEQELRVARVIQQTLLPKEVPDAARLAGRGLLAAGARRQRRFLRLYRFSRWQAGLVIGDVTDKGVPAALVMATTRSILRAGAAALTLARAQILAYVNDLLCPDIPPNMFVTCLYAVLDPTSGPLAVCQRRSRSALSQHPAMAW